MIQFTARAIEHLNEAVENEEIVRVAVVGGGCSGFTYTLAFTQEVDEEDIQLDIPGVKVYIDPHSADILKNTTVDYQSNLHRYGFVFTNPDANSTCGCGMSFS
jgi:iron-sulfur cluster assembly accessory protein